MKRIVILMGLLALTGCGRDQPPPLALPQESDDSEVHVTAGSIKAEQQARKAMALMTVEEAVKGFRVIHKRFPVTLQELVDRGMLGGLPELPEGMSFSYDSATGTVEVKNAKEVSL
jgi:predicted small lipoprotein YifL